MQDSDNKMNSNDDWMFDNPFMNKVATKGGEYMEMDRPSSIIPEPVIESVAETKSVTNVNPFEITEDDCYKSLTPSALQAPGWRTPTEFPCCPKEVVPDGLKEYENNLKPGLMFSSNQYDNYYVIERAIDPKENLLYVLSTNNKDGYFGAYSVARIEIKYNKFIHISMKRFGDASDATKFYKSLIGEYELTDDETILFWES